MTDQELAEDIAEFLRSEGYRPTVDEDSDVIFKSEGRTYIIQVDSRDPCFFRLIYPNFWSLESDDERERALEAASEANKVVKVAKIFLVRDDTWASIELFCETPDSYKALLTKSMGALQAGVHHYVKLMKGEAGED
jgi:hypothetical protein